MLKKYFLSVFLVFFVFFQSINFSFGEEQNSYKDYTLNMGDFFVMYFDLFSQNVDDNYKKIELKMSGVEKGGSLYGALQKGVFLGKIKNVKGYVDFSKKVKEEQLYAIIKNAYKLEIPYKKGKELTFSKVTDSIKVINSKIENENKINLILNSQKPEIEGTNNFFILNDVYYKLKNYHYNSANFSENELIDGAIKGMTEATKDKYTTYFPPVDSKSFQDSLKEDYEGIGAYVDMEKPGLFKIVSPIAGSPAEEAGLKGGDIVLQIDDLLVTEKVTLDQAVAKIKGLAGTQVKLKIQRGDQAFDISVTRKLITMKFVDYKQLDNGDFYIKLRIFGAGINKAFEGAITNLKSNTGFNGKIIIDLRNNPGGQLDEVAAMLDKFVPKGKSTVNIKYKDQQEEDINSNGSDLYDFSNKKIVVLVNKGSASASEIMAGTMRDYLGNNIKIIGETTYGKGSVQNLDLYSDTSSFKYTIAKWFTGKTKTGIDGIGIKPDTEVKLDEEKVKTGIDNQLDYAKNLSF
ncbi:MAG: S41 family peptidase [Candidatus Gracilibacteria bacterium]|nr:S41 family peptidase [Candidatus Gracilibacteria bacterium]MDD3120248.1 S41 family peptidase [Candidatus Gracilibacteria bacterium]